MAATAWALALSAYDVQGAPGSLLADAVLGFADSSGCGAAGLLRGKLNLRA